MPSPQTERLKVVVFGGAGFLGSHVADSLSDAGHEVIVFDREPSRFLRDTQRGLVGDILDETLVDEAVRGCDVAYNFAGLADISDANAAPLEAVRSNVLGNTVLLEAGRRHRLRRFVFASTVYVYSRSGGVYRSSKQACELLIESYQELFGLDFTVLRFGSLYGDRANDKNWIHRALKQALLENRIVRYGDGQEVREYIHVRDAARSSVQILDEEYRNQHVIISGPQAIRTSELLTMVREIMGNNLRIEYEPPQDPTTSSIPSLHYQLTPYSFNPRLARKLFGHAYVDLGQGLLHCLREVQQELALAAAAESATDAGERPSR